MKVARLDYESRTCETWVDEITDFLLSRPTAEQIIAFRVSDPVDERLHELLDKNQDDELSTSERAELDGFLQLDHLFTILKAKARLKLRSKA